MTSSRELSTQGLRRFPDRRTFRNLRGIAVLGVAVVLLALFSPLIEPVQIPPVQVARILIHQISGGSLVNPVCDSGIPTTRCAAFTEIVWNFQFPAVLLALAVGAALGLAGATLQGVFRNPLADPYLLGLSSGASLGAATQIAFRIGASQANLTLPLLAFVGAGVTGTVILLAALSPRSTPVTLLLTGVALSQFLSAILATLLLYFSAAGNLQVSFWLLGGLSGATWDRAGIVLGVVFAAGALLLLFGRELNLLQLGGDVAQSLGMDTRRARIRLIALTTIVTSVGVAFTGIIGFVGLISPHIVRRTLGADYRVVLPAAALVGACFLTLAYNLSQVLIAGVVIPVGIPTAFAGFPFFLYLLYRHQRQSFVGISG